MKINNLIGISSAINGGKDLVGKMVIYIDNDDNPTFEGFNSFIDIGGDFEVKKCADKLKDCVCLVIGCTRKDLENEVFKNTPLGKEWERYALKTSYCPNYPDNDITETIYFGTEEEAIDELVQLVRIYGKDYLDGNITKEVLTPRKILQLFGTQGGRRQVHPNIWVNSLFSDYKPKYVYGIDPANDNPKLHTSAIYPKWVITDVRFPDNEGVAVRKRGGLLIGIKRKFSLKFPEYAYLMDITRPSQKDEYSTPLALQNENIELYKSLTHESELSMGDHSWCDVVIENNGSIEDLFNKVLNALKNN